MTLPPDIGTPDLLARVRSGAWLDSQDFPPLRWAVPGVLAEGLSVFSGAPKTGKSWAMLGVALAVASGGYALGRLPVGEPRPVLLLALEDGDRRLQERCRRLLNGAPIPSTLAYATRADSLEIIPLIERWLDTTGTTDALVVLDTLGRVTPPAMAGETTYARDYRIGARLKAITDARPGMALTCVHHTRKASAEDWLDATSGTQGLAGSADSVLTLTRPRNENTGTLRVTGRDVPEGEYALTVCDGSWTLNGATLADAAKAAQQAKATAGLGDRSTEIVRLIGEHPTGLGPTALGVMLGISARDAGTYLRRLVDAGRIQQTGRGVYVPSAPPVETVESVESEGADVLPFHTFDSFDTPTPGGDW